MKDKLLVGALGLLPKNLVSRAVGAAAHARLPGALGKASVRAFTRLFEIDPAEAERPLEEYPTVGAFFTRRLKNGARLIDRRPGIAVCPADGRFLNGGRLESGTLLQAKGRRFSVSALLRSEADAERFGGGSWATIYLSPRDYHRVHHPVEGRITSARYIPGRLWPVNRLGVERVEGLFCVNERVITFVDSPLGEVAVIMVGATSVGRMDLTYDEALKTNQGQPAAERAYEPPLRVARGDELGVFNLGSTVIVLFAESEVQVEERASGEVVRLGQPLARRGR